jgi:hypothetical protein
MRSSVGYPIHHFQSPFPSVIQRMIYGQSGSVKQFLGPTPLRFIAIRAVVRTRRIGPVVRARISGESPSSWHFLRHL